MWEMARICKNPTAGDGPLVGGFSDQVACKMEILAVGCCSNCCEVAVAGVKTSVLAVTHVGLATGVQPSHMF